MNLLVQNKQARVFISGSGGIGKTSLALTVRVAHDPQVAERFGSHRYWVPCEEAQTPAAFVQTVIRSLEIIIPPSSSDPFKELVRLLLIAEPVPRLLILDNYETTWDTEHQAQVRDTLRTLAAVKGVSILITTRDADHAAYGLAWSQPLLRPLGQLSLGAARTAYLQYQPGASQDDQLDSLLLAIDCYPLAITLMASQGALGESPSSLLRRWEEEKSALLSTGIDKHSNLELSIAFSINSRVIRDNPEAIQVLGMLSILPSGTTIDMLPQIPHLRRLVNVLIKVSLASRSLDPPIIDVLSPISAYTLKNHPPSGATVDSLYLAHVQIIDRFHDSEPKSGERRNATEVLNRAYPNIGSVFRYSLVHGDQRLTFSSIVNYTRCFCFQHPGHDILRYALSRATNDSVSPAERAEARFVLGLSLYKIADFTEANVELEAAERLFKSIGNLSKATHCQWHRGEALLKARRFSEANELVAITESSFRSLGDERMATKCQWLLGEIFVEEGHCIERLEKLAAVDLPFKSVKDRWIAAQCGRLLGDVLLQDGRFLEARRSYEAAKLSFRSVQDNQGLARCQGSLGHLNEQEGRYAEAEEEFENAMLLYESVGEQEETSRFRRYAAESKFNLGQVFWKEGRYAEAKENLNAAVLSHKIDKNSREASRCQFTLGLVLSEEGCDVEAKEAFKAAELSCKSSRDQYEVYACMDSLAGTALGENRYAEAKVLLKDAELFYESSGSEFKLRRAWSQEFSGDILLQEGRYAEAKEIYKAAALSFESYGDAFGSARLQQLVGDVFWREGHHNEANKQYKAAALACKIVDRYGSSNSYCLRGLGTLQLDGERHPFAKENLEAAALSYKIDEDTREVSRCQFTLSLVLLEEGRDVEAKAAFKAAQLSCKRSDQSNANECLWTLAGAAFSENRHVEAKELLEGPELSNESGKNIQRVAGVQQMLGDIFLTEGRYAEAKGRYSAAALSFESAGDQYCAGRCQQTVGNIFLREGRQAEAVEKFETAKSFFVSQEDKKEPIRCQEILNEIRRTRDPDMLRTLVYARPNLHIPSF